MQVSTDRGVARNVARGFALGNLITGPLCALFFFAEGKTVPAVAYTAAFVASFFVLRSIGFRVPPTEREGER